MYSLHWIGNRKIAIFGTALNSVRCTYYLKEKGIKIACYINNNREVGCFCDCPVYEIDELPQGMFILVATSIEVYLSISKQLCGSGLREFQDYIYYEWLYKKIVLLHGNCHMAIIRSFLLSSETFRGRYSVYPNPEICNNSDRKIEKEVLYHSDVWIHEDIRLDNEYGYYLSDEYMRNQMKESVVEIIIPHLFGLGKLLFPQSDWNKRNDKIANGKDANGMFPYADKVIDRCVEQKMKKEEIIAFCNGKCLDVESVKENFETYLHKIRERETCWDIKILDYILNNYKEKKLFFDMGHPTNDIFEKICLDILDMLHIEDKNIVAEFSLDMHEEPVYPVVKDILGLKWSDQFIRNGRVAKKACEKMDFREYIEEYLWWCYGRDDKGHIRI